MELHHIGNIVRFAIVSVVLIAAVTAPSAPLYATDCFAQYKQDVNACSNIPNWDDRSICGLDAGVRLTGCVRRGVLGV